MKRRGFILAMVGYAPMIAQQNQPQSEFAPEDLRIKVMALETPWNIFIRKLFGCPYPTGETTTETCTRPSELDVASFEKAKRAAEKLWGLISK